MRVPASPRFATVALLAGLAALLTPVRAGTGVSVDVGRVELQGSPGQLLTGSVNVRHPGNATDARVGVRGFLNDFALPAQGAAQFLPAGSTSRSVSRWVRFTPDTFDLAPGQEQNVRYTIQVPPDAKPGLYWGVLFFNSRSPDEKRPSANSASLEYLVDVGQLLYVQVGPGLVDGRLSAVTASAENGRVTVRATLKNNGSALIRAVGRALVRDASGKTLLTLGLPESVALPGFSRVFEASAPSALPPGEYITLVALQYGRNQFFTGETRLKVRP